MHMPGFDFAYVLWREAIEGALPGADSGKSILFKILRGRADKGDGQAFPGRCGLVADRLAGL